MERIENKLVMDLKQEYPQLLFDGEDALWDMFQLIYENVSGQQFVFIFDEWDYIFHREFVTEKDKRAYIEFLSDLLKDKPYVAFAYMTGILPIVKYSSGSELNMFMEYTMATKEKFSEQFGFVDEEVDLLYEKYKEREINPMIRREDLKEWYDGYQTFSGKRIYNPRSVVCALNDNQISNYWTSSGPYDEIFYYIEHNIEEVRDDLARMVAGESVPAKIQEYAAISMKLNTRDEIFSAMVVYGFLSFSDGYVSIPNKEL